MIEPWYHMHSLELNCLSGEWLIELRCSVMEACQGWMPLMPCISGTIGLSAKLTASWTKVAHKHITIFTSSSLR